MGKRKKNKKKEPGGGEGKTREKSEEKERKGFEAQRVKPPTPTLAMDALIGEEEQNGKQKKGFEA